MPDIARAIHRPANYATKHFGFELGAITTIIPESDKYIVNGKHDKSKLDEVLDTFIRKFVLCSKCDLPETNMVFSKSTITLRCQACGNSQQVNTAGSDECLGFL